MNVLDAKRARVMARVGGVLYLIIIAIGAVGEAVVRERVVVGGDAAATAANLRSMEGLWRLGVAGEVVLLSCAAALAVILYVLLRRVSREVALAALFFNLVSIAVEGAAALCLAAALLSVSNAPYLNALAPEQVQAMAMLAIGLHSIGFAIALVFFGIECVLLGYLIHRSGYMPRIIGALMAIAGVCYVVNSFAVLLSPPLAGLLFPAILLPALVAESSLALWLLVKGVNAERWDRQAGRAEEGSARAGATATA